ncbi:MAG: hypothetical protein HKN32_06050 [Flavobacteriales bacterium]|nr:hypothetical protein [Flavobacteriales bacterium]
MNLQTILDPVRQLMEWTFVAIMEGNPEPAALLNWAIIAVGGLGFFFWMKTQKDYNEKAMRDSNAIA